MFDDLGQVGTIKRAPTVRMNVAWGLLGFRSKILASQFAHTEPHGADGALLLPMSWEARKP